MGCESGENPKENEAAENTCRRLQLDLEFPINLFRLNIYSFVTLQIIKIEENYIAKYFHVCCEFQNLQFYSSAHRWNLKTAVI